MVALCLDSGRGEHYCVMCNKMFSCKKERGTEGPEWYSLFVLYQIESIMEERY